METPSCEEIEEKEENAMQEGPSTPLLHPFQALESHTSPPSPIKTFSAQEALKQVSTTLAPQLTTVAKNGVSKTTLLLHTPLLKEIEIEIDHYDTCPSQFVLIFRGDEAAQKVLQTHHAQLTKQLQQSLPSFHFHIETPTYKPWLKKRWRKEKNSLVKTKQVRYCANST